MRNIYLVILILGIPMFGFCANVFSITIHIPADYPTIQDGIQLANTGDTVLVAPGTYDENLDFQGRAITVKSEGGYAVTVINGQQLGSVVRFVNEEGPDSVLEGFTLTNGSGNLSPDLETHGGAISCRFSSPTLIGNRITHNKAFHGGGIHCYSDSHPVIFGNLIEDNESIFDGGGIYCSSFAKPHIENNVIRNNTGSLNQGAGAGIYCYWATGPKIINNEITGNYCGYGAGITCDFRAGPLIEGNLITDNYTTYTWGSGGGIMCHQESHPVINKNIIAYNSAVNDGGAIVCGHDATPLLTNNLIYKNTAERHGGGIYCFDETPIRIINCTLVGNEALIEGGAIFCERSDAWLTNNIFWDNQAPVAPELWIGLGSRVTIRYCTVKGGQGSVHLEPDSSLGWGAGMIALDPLFRDPANDDYHLTFSSPCIDGGSNQNPDLPGKDFEGDPRIAGPSGGLFRLGEAKPVKFADIGADEYYLTKKQLING